MGKFLQVSLAMNTKLSGIRVILVAFSTGLHASPPNTRWIEFVVVSIDFTMNGEFLEGDLLALECGIRLYYRA